MRNIIVYLLAGLVCAAATVALDPFSDRALDAAVGITVFFGLVLAADYLEANFFVLERLRSGKLLGRR